MIIRISFILAAVLLAILPGCRTNKSIDKTETIQIDQQKIFPHISIIPHFQKKFEVISFCEVNPYKDGIVILRNRPTLSYITAIDFDGNITIDNKECKFDRQAPDRLSYGALSYEPQTRELWNILYPYVKKFDLTTLQVASTNKMPDNSNVFNTSKYLIPRPIIFSSGDEYYWTFSDQSTSYQYKWGIARTKRDFSQSKIFFQFSKPWEEWYKKGVEKRVIEIDGFAEQSHDRFPFTVDTTLKNVFFSRDIWQPEILRISSTGVVTQFVLKTEPSPCSAFNDEDLDIAFKWHNENLPKDLKSMYQSKKKEMLHNPYILDMFLFKSYLIIITPSYRESKRERIAYVLNKDNLSFLGSIYIPSYGNTVDFFITGNYLVEHSLTEVDNDIYHTIAVSKISAEGNQP